jgi:hypothetical protein
MLTGLIAVLSAVASAVGTAIAAIIRVMPYWVWLGFAILLGGIYLGNGCSGVPSGCSLRELACGCRPKEPRPPKSDTYTVDSCPTGAAIIVRYGFRDRQRGTIALAHIQAEPGEASRLSLESLAGATVRVEWSRGGLLRSEAPDAQDDATGPPEARPPAVGVVYGAGGNCLNLEQAMSGHAVLLADAPKEWVRAVKTNKGRK